jgi:biopolymer transport protein ExbD
MATNAFDDDDDEVMSEINTTPLVDVMLVLLIIFIVTVPVMTHSVKLDLPRASNQATVTKPQNINLAIDAQGNYFWNEQPVTAEDFAFRVTQAAQQAPQPELHLRADREVRYEAVARAMAVAQRAGLSRIGFVTEPEQP